MLLWGARLCPHTLTECSAKVPGPVGRRKAEAAQRVKLEHRDFHHWQFYFASKKKNSI